MTVPFPLDAFDAARPIRPKRQWPKLDTDRLLSIGTTIAVHGVILALAFTAVHVSRTKVMPAGTVQITPEKHEVADDVKPTPKMVTPSVITVPPPEFTVRTAVPPPVMAPAPLAAPAPPVSVVVPSKGTEESGDTYRSRVLAQLNRFKQYPRAARQARIEGVVMLHFVMQADGKVSSFEIAKSSGRPVLDAEALALIQRAQPLPALPADFPTRTLDAVVPIEFSLAG